MFWAVIPIKDHERSLRRLSPVLPAWERRRLLAALLEDVISSVIQVKALDVVAVVAAGGEVVDAARRHGVAWIQEVENRGHSIAVADAAAQLARNGVQTMLTITADVPLVRPSELENVILQHPPAPALTIAPSRSGIGSNCLVCSPPDVIPFSFGGHSLRRHLALARSAQAATRMIHLPGIGLDIDTPSDLDALLEARGSTLTHQFLASISMPARLADYMAHRPSGQRESRCS